MHKCLTMLAFEKDKMQLENDIMKRARRVLRVLQKGDAFRDQFEIEGTAGCEPFEDRFQNHLAGWAVTFTINTYDNMTYC